MSSFAINRNMFCSTSTKQPSKITAGIKRAIIGLMLGITAIGWYHTDTITEAALEHWNTILLEYGIVRPSVEIDVADPVFFDSVVTWAAERAGGMPNTNKELIAKFITIAFAESANQKIDPLVTIAVMSVESRFNFMADSGSGAKGLMQIIPSWHRNKIAVAQVYDPVSNIRAGTMIIRENLKSQGGNLNRALLLYNGSLGLPGSNYDTKVLNARHDLQRHIERDFIKNFKRNYERK